MKREKAIILLLFAGAMWSLGGLLIKSIPWPPLAISGLRGGIAAIVIYIYSRNDKITITKDKIIAACFYTLVVTLFVMANKLTTAGMQYYYNTQRLFMSRYLDICFLEKDLLL